MNTEIHHCVYTHARDGRSGAGGRFEAVENDAAELLPHEANRELRALLEKLQPEHVKQPAFVMKRFSGDAKRFACFIVSYGGFEDAAGRKGVLSHARVVPLERDSVWFDPFPLVAQAESFDMDAVRAAEPIDRLQAYLEKIRNESVEVRALTRRAVQELPRELLRTVLIASLGDAHARRRVLAPDAPLTQIARAWAALPVGLQRAMPWAYAASEGLPVPLAWSAHASAMKPSATMTETVNRYIALLESNQELNPLVLDENLELGAFAQRLQRAGPAAREREVEMPKRPQKTEPGTAADLNRQYDAIAESLKQYVDQRLEAHEYQLRRSGAVAATPLRTDGRMLLIAGMIAGALIAAAVFGGVQYWNGRNSPRIDAAPIDVSQPFEPEEPATEPERVSAAVAGASDNLRRIVREAAATKKWAEGFLDVTTSEPETVAALIEKTILHDTTGPQSRGRLADLQARLRERKLTPADRAALRDYFVQYIAADVTGAKVVVDEKLTELTPAIVKQMKTATGAASAETQAANDDLQGEIILRWLEQHPS